MPADRKKQAPEGCYWRGEVLWARFVVGGKEYRFSLKTGDPGVARNRAAAEHAKIVAAHSYGEDRKLWADAVTAWGQYMVAQVGSRTFDRYTNSLDTIDDHLAGLHVDEVSDDTVAEIIRARRAAGVSTATIRRDLTALSSVLGFAVDEKWRKGNPALDAMRSRRMKERRDPIVLPEDRDIERVISRAPGLFKHLIRAALLTGCRQDELVTLERRHVDLARRAIRVRGKGNKAREVSLTDEAVALFADIPANLATRAVFWHPGTKGKPSDRARDQPEPGPFLNAASRFGLYCRDVVAAEAEEIAAAVKRGLRIEPTFRRFRFHDLRHRFAVDYLRSGRGGIYDLQQEMGHTSIKVTEAYLAFLTAEEKGRAKNAPAQNTAQVHRFPGSTGA
ncbi:tyrosine-type recombinase/integrase [Methylobacterium nonmethylotrophicum]|uniref:Site-specific integrase n=1 Tax=Methylobacterium nonmethylotrophicum TaxID=1141884 RepID=A0A4Z0NN50_9HYPH|nr:tyrosine-type recombinase/integrase [Methylobacterium nonmethylotrophicum]TGD98065.1 site-specific integrase [Methylobacterium nonmethylotrophicum]